MTEREVDAAQNITRLITNGALCEDCHKPTTGACGYPRKCHRCEPIEDVLKRNRERARRRGRR